MYLAVNYESLGLVSVSRPKAQKLLVWLKSYKQVLFHSHVIEKISRFLSCLEEMNLIQSRLALVSLYF